MDPNNDKTISIYYELLTILKNENDAFQSNRDRLYSRLIGFISLIATVFSLSFLNYNYDTLNPAIRGLISFHLTTIILFFLVVLFITDVGLFIWGIKTRTYHVFPYENINLGEIKSLDDAREEKVLNALIESYKKQLASLEIYVNKIGKIFNLVLGFGSATIIVCVCNLIVSLV